MTLGKSFASLGNLISEYQNNGGFAKPSRYEIIITPPVCLGVANSNFQ